MSEVNKKYDTPLWIADNQVTAVAGALSAGKIQAVENQLAGQKLIELTDLFQSCSGKSVKVWGTDPKTPLLAVAEFPDGQMSVATKGGIMLAFKDCCQGCGADSNAALLTTNSQQCQFFGKNPKSIIPDMPQFRAVDSDLGHYAIHMIDVKDHVCGGL